MRQVKRIPGDKEYDFGIGTIDQFGLRKRAGNFVTEKEVLDYQISEKYLEVKGEEKKDWNNELPEGTDKIVFYIETEISGGDKVERERMINQFEGEFKDYIREKGGVVLKVSGVQVVKKKKR